MRNGFAVLALLCCSSLAYSTQSQLDRINSYYRPLGYILLVSSVDGANYTLAVPDDVFVAVESSPTMVPLLPPPDDLPLVFRGSVIVRLLRVEKLEEHDGVSMHEIMANAPVGLAIKDGTLELRPRK